MNRVSGYRVYEKDGHMYVDMSVNVEEMFYDYSQEVYRLHSEVLSYLHNLGREWDIRATTHQR